MSFLSRSPLESGLHCRSFSPPYGTEAPPGQHVSSLTARPCRTIRNRLRKSFSFSSRPDFFFEPLKFFRVPFSIISSSLPVLQRAYFDYIEPLSTLFVSPPPPPFRHVPRVVRALFRLVKPPLKDASSTSQIFLLRRMISIMHSSFQS